MLEHLSALYGTMAKWLNENQGVAGVGIFLITLLLGWGSGIFSALRRRPKFRITFIAGPTFCCTFPTGGECDGTPIHRTGIALYLAIANIGSAASSLESISVAYHWHLRPLSVLWLRYRIGWFWLHSQTAIVHDFQARIGENVKIYPFLTQRSILSGADPSTFLEPGRATNGVVYFEQSDSWGGCFPSPTDGQVKIKVGIRDVFGRMHKAKFRIPAVSMEDARRYNPSFGKTFAELRNETLPHDERI
jgi:hypothetical protein